MAVSFADAPGMDTTGVAGGRVFGDLRVMCKRVTLDSAYPTGGYTIPAGSTGLGMPGGRVLFADTAMTDENAANPIVPWYEPSTGVLKMYTDTGEAANNTNLTGIVVQIIAYGY